MVIRLSNLLPQKVNISQMTFIALSIFSTASFAQTAQVTQTTSAKHTLTKPKTVAQKTASTNPPVPASQPTPTSTRIDWTPVLKTMQDGCDLPDIENAPDIMKSSIVSISGTNTKAISDGYKVIVLKNATAWGYPIKKIQFGAQGPGFSSATVYFNDNRFMSLRSKFYVNTIAGKLTAKDKTVIRDSNAFAGQYLANGLGYNDGRSGVYFSQKTNSITCSWAHL